MVNSRSKYSKKAVAIVCFFLFLSGKSFAVDNVWQFEPSVERIYKLVLNLQTEQAYAELAQLKNVSDFHKLYVQSFLETTDILITEDEKRFDKVNELFKQRIDRISQLPDGPESLFLKAELSLQRGFNLLNLGQELNAVLAIRQAYQATQECIKKYPNFIPIKKTYGVIQVMVGSVPDKYQWFMSLLGMKGSVAVGQKNLEELRLSKSSLNLEATILFYSIKGFINQKYGEAATGFKECLIKDPDSRLLLFLAINMLMKDSQSEEALSLIHELDSKPSGLPMEYIDYLRAEVLMERGDYLPSIQSFQKYIKNSKTQSYRKDSFYKMGLCYYLAGNNALAEKNFDIARKTGKTSADPDKYAAAMLEERTLPNPKILKLRFYTDGGYYKEAKDLLKTISTNEITTEKDQVELVYRKARLSHKTQDIGNAKSQYVQAINMTGSQPWYFAPNAALQLGYISQEQGDLVSAKKYYEKALSYKRYEYKNGIDSKAKAALESLKK